MNTYSAPSITIDANCVIGLLDRESATATSLGDLRELMRHGLSNRAQVSITTRVEIDFGRDKDTERRAAMLEQLDMFPVIASVRRTRSDVADPMAIVDADERALWREIQGIVFPGLTDASGRLANKLADVDHLAGHKLAGRDVFVTDDGGILRRQAELRDRPGIVVMSPEGCVRLVDDHVARSARKELRSKADDPRFRDERLHGVASFDYSDNDGLFSIGSGINLFETMWSKAGDTSIRAYRDAASIEAIALVKDCDAIEDVRDATAYEFSSRSRNPAIEHIVVWRNANGIYAATRIVEVKDDTRGADRDWLAFEYRILPDGSTDFSRS